LYSAALEQRVIAAQGARVTDAQGTISGLHRPGFRLAANTTRDSSHYEQRDAADAVAWQTGSGENESIVPQEGDFCSVQNAEFPLDFGSPGTMQMYRGRLTCVPDEPRSGSVDDHAKADPRAASYRAYDFATANAWRTPR
jgi:hypothetical protein